MSYKKSEAPLNIELQPSRILLLLVSFVYLGGGILMAISIKPWYLLAPVSLILLLSFLLNLRKLGWICSGLETWLMPWQYTEKLIWLSDNSWRLILNGGKSVEARLLGTSTCLPCFATLNFSVASKSLWHRRRSVVIVPDTIEKEVFRQLRVRLRTRPIEIQDS